MVDAGSSGVMVVLHRDADTEDVMRAYMHAWKVRPECTKRVSWYIGSLSRTRGLPGWPCADTAASLVSCNPHLIFTCQACGTKAPPGNSSGRREKASEAWVQVSLASRGVLYSANVLAPWLLGYSKGIEVGCNALSGSVMPYLPHAWSHRHISSR